jgi:lipoprotein-anchoring transpeptidase ErfK/SrfK
MRQRILMGAGMAAAAIVAIGGLILAGQQGWFGGQHQLILTTASRLQQQGKLVEAQAKLEEFINAQPDSPGADDALLQLGGVYEAQEQLGEAQATYRLLLSQFPDSSLMTPAQARLGKVNVALLFSPVLTATDMAHEVRPGDTLGKIASQYRTTVDFLKRTNGLSSDMIRPGQKLKIPKGKFSIAVDKSLNQLLLTADSQFIKSYPVATGKENSTPVGTFKITTKIPNPVWWKEGASVPADSPENILGTRWMGFDLKGYGIHGTTDPGALGKQVTAGCVRMSNTDVEELFDIVPAGTEVTIVD